MEQHQKARAVIRTMQLSIEGERVQATRGIQHLKILKKYMLDTGRTSLTTEDCEDLLRQAGPDPVFEVPSDTELLLDPPAKNVTNVPNEKPTNVPMKKPTNVRKKKPTNLAKGKGKETASSVNPSITNSAPSTNRSRILTPESVSPFDSDSDPDFIPSN